MATEPRTRLEGRPLFEHVEQLKVESGAVRGLHEPTWDDNFNFYRGDQWGGKSPPKGLRQFTHNRLQNAIIASAAVQTEQRPRVRFEPVETNEPPVFFLNPSVGEQVLERLAQGNLEVVSFTTAQFSGAEPIDRDQVVALLSIPGDDVDPVTGLPQPMFGEDAIIRIDDAAVAEMTQKIYDRMWGRTHADYSWIENITNKLVIGHQAMLTEWDVKTRLPRRVILHPLQVWIDPIASDVYSAQYVIWDQFISKDEAKSLFPQHAAVIDSQPADGSRIGSSGNTAFRDTAFQRQMLTIRTAWLRSQTVPVSDTAAIESGFKYLRDPDGVVQKDRAGQPLFEAPDGRVTGPSDPEGWPTESGIRQVTFIGDRVVEDGRCAYDDIPIVWNVNIPIPYRPWGQGEPQRMRGVQEAINRVMSILHNHLMYYQSPVEILPRSVKNALPKDAALHSHSGKSYTVPDELYEQFGNNLKLFIDPPTLPASYVDFLVLLLQEIDTIGGHAEVLQGRAAGRVESGKAIDLLQSAARGTIGYKSLYTEKAINQEAKLILGMIRDFVDSREMARYVSGLPEQVLLAVQNRLKDLDFDVSVEVISGKGANRRLDQQQAVENFQAGLLSRESTMKRREIPDVQGEIEKMANDPLLAAEPQEATGQSP